MKGLAEFYGDAFWQMYDPATGRINVTDTQEACEAAARPDLDRCGGHDVTGIGYHYHAAEPGANAILGCHTGETGCSLDDPDASCDATRSGRRGPPPGGRPPPPQ